MKKWNFKIKSTVQEISEKLDATLGSSERFVFTKDHTKNDSVTFKLQKRGLYAFYLMFLNKIVVHGKIIKSPNEDESTIEISFNQYFLWKLIVAAHFVLILVFLITLIFGGSDSAYKYVFGGILIALGIVLWIEVQNKFKKDIQAYKTLFSKILIT